MTRIYRRPFDKLPPTEQERSEQSQKRIDSWNQYKARVECVSLIRAEQGEKTQ